MAPTQPVLEANNLPHPAAPDGYSEETLYRGTAQEMADGSITYDLVNTTAKHLFTLRWRNITTAQRSTVETAYAAIKTGYNNNNYTAPTGSTYTVTRDPSQDSLDWTVTVDGGGTLHWSGELRLREV